MSKSKVTAILLIVVCIVSELGIFGYIIANPKSTTNLIYIEPFMNWNIYQWSNNNSYTAVRNPDPLNWGPIPSGPTINYAYFGVAFLEPFYNGTLYGDIRWKNLAGNLTGAFS